MSIKYGLTVENQKLITEKASSKSDGCYQFRGVAYRVVNGRVTHFASNGSVFEFAYGFNVRVGVCNICSDEALKFLKRMNNKL